MNYEDKLRRMGYYQCLERIDKGGTKNVIDYFIKHLEIIAEFANNEKQFETCVECYTKILQQSPSRMADRFNRSIAYNALGQYTKEIADLDYLIKKTSNDEIECLISYMTNKGLAYYRLKKYKESMGIFNELVDFLKEKLSQKKYKNSKLFIIHLMRSHLSRSCSREGEGRINCAIRDNESVLSLNTKTWMKTNANEIKSFVRKAHENLYRLKLESDLDGAIKHLTIVIKNYLEPNEQEEDFYFEIIEYLKKKRKFKKMVPFLDKITNVLFKPEHFELLNIYVINAPRERCLYYINSLIESNPRIPSFRFFKARIFQYRYKFYHLAIDNYIVAKKLCSLINDEKKQFEDHVDDKIREIHTLLRLKKIQKKNNLTGKKRKREENDERKQQMIVVKKKQKVD